ncbi:hypothetical protein KPY62_01590 [Psychrobacter sp. TAE2020]|uniref:hypothetical protein n=1 Tax=Psychrobacter sp. TAE2020 TaxID=2846762 RepID=UPI001C114F96|nr:hypothetical protein [Psychrobacter sp. TAE2020]MBU5615814.1 hypothetical protein [Psychrobacter sp. TAE2020]
MSDDTVTLAATVEAIQEGELTNSIDNKDTLNQFNAAITQGTDADGTQISLVEDLRNVEGNRVQGTTNVINGTDTYIATDSMSNVVEVINHDAAHQNGQGEAAADVIGKTGNSAFNVGKWANSGAIAEERTTITPRPITSTNDAKAQQEQLAIDKEKLEAQQDAGDAFENDDGTFINGRWTTRDNAILIREAMKKYPNSPANQNAYIQGKRSATGSGIAKAGNDLAEFAADPKSAITNSFRGMINVLTDPNKAGRDMRAAIIQWKGDYNKALKDNPRLAGQMRGELEEAVGMAVAGTVMTGPTTSAIKSLRATGKFDINTKRTTTIIYRDKTTGLSTVEAYSTNLDIHGTLNVRDQGKFKPAEAATGAQLEPVLGKMQPYSGSTLGANPDWVITEGVNKGKTVDAMYTTNNLKDSEIKGLNYGFGINFKKGTEISQIQKHLSKADFVTIDFRVLNSQNQKIFTDYVKTLPKKQQDQIIIIQPPKK